MLASFPLSDAFSFYPRSLRPDLFISDDLISSFDHASKRYNLVSSRLEDVSLSLILILSIFKGTVPQVPCQILDVSQCPLIPLPHTLHILLSLLYPKPPIPPFPISIPPQNLTSSFLLFFWRPFDTLLNDDFYLLNRHFLLQIFHKRNYH